MASHQGSYQEFDDPHGKNQRRTRLRAMTSVTIVVLLLIIVALVVVLIVQWKDDGGDDSSGSSSSDNNNSSGEDNNDANNTNNNGQMTASNGTYWHNWSDENGTTHLTQCTLTNWTYVNYLPPSDPLYTNVKGASSNVLFLNLPTNWSGPWHKDPVPQLVFFINGIGKWKTMDGSQVILKPGDVYFGNDQNSTKGHESYNIGNTSLILALIQFDTWSQNKYKPCWLK